MAREERSWGGMSTLSFSLSLASEGGGGGVEYWLLLEVWPINVS